MLAAEQVQPQPPTQGCPGGWHTLQAPCPVYLTKDPHPRPPMCSPLGLSLCALLFHPLDCQAGDPNLLGGGLTSPSEFAGSGGGLLSGASSLTALSTKQASVSQEIATVSKLWTSAGHTTTLLHHFPHAG